MFKYLGAPIKLTHAAFSYLCELQIKFSFFLRSYDSRELMENFHLFSLSYLRFSMNFYAFAPQSQLQFPYASTNSEMKERKLRKRVSKFSLWENLIPCEI